MSTVQQTDWPEQRLDVLVVGGGIVGAGIARDAAQRGLQVGLVEQADFATGTSGRSSRLLHGGLRYLAQGRLRMVREASREKRIVHHIAPHLSTPLAFWFPARRGTAWSAWKLRLGVRLYDLLCGGDNLGESSWSDRAGTLQELPGLNPKGLVGAARYFDSLTSDARLVIDSLRSAGNCGAWIRNYARLVDARLEAGAATAWYATVQDERTERERAIRARAIVNATGPWSESLVHSRTRLRLTKGVHLVVRRARLPVPDAVVMAAGDRILFALPWGERVILGTTDTDYNGPVDQPECGPEDCRYILAAVADTFPAAALDQADVVSQWAGLRPLVADRHGRPSDISRRHEIQSPEPGWWDVTGGKLTTYRLIAEETVDQLTRYLDARTAPCRTASTPLADGLLTAGVSGVLPPAVGRPAVDHYCRHEWAVHLADVMVRRTSWRYYHADHTAIAEKVAAWMGSALCWKDQQRRAELAAYGKGND